MKDFEKTLNYCLYICIDDGILAELTEIQIKSIAGFTSNIDFKRLKEIEKILIKEKKASEARIFKPMTQDELNNRIDQSESDFRNNRFKSSSELLAKYE